MTRGWGKHQVQGNAARTWTVRCEACGNDFESGSPNGRWCGEACKRALKLEQQLIQRAYRQRRAETKAWESIHYEVVIDPDKEIGFLAGARLGNHELEKGLKFGVFSQGMEIRNRFTGEHLVVVGQCLVPKGAT